MKWGTDDEPPLTARQYAAGALAILAWVAVLGIVGVRVQ